MNLEVKEISTSEKDITLKVEGEIDVFTAPQLREKLMPLCQHGSRIHLDLSKVNYIDSTGLGVLVGAYKAQRASNGRLILTGMNDRIMRLFRITNLHEIIEIEEKNQEADQ